MSWRVAGRVGAAIVLVAGCASTTGAGAGARAVTRTLLNPQWLGPAPTDFTQTIAVSGGQTIYVSAQTAWDPSQNAVVGRAISGRRPRGRSRA